MTAAMKRILKFALCALLLTGLVSCMDQSRHSKSYEPIPLFAPAYRALGEAQQEDSTYNLDATMRIIRAIEIARSQSEDFGPFMDLLAHQDYRYVAGDVLEAERNLFPVLQKMYLLEQENDKFQGIWGLVTATEDALEDLGGSLLTTPSPDITLLLKSISLVSAVDNVFDQFTKIQKIKEKNRKELNALRAEYTAALQESWPVFMKYKEEWEKLCILKDQAYLDVYDGRNVSACNLAVEILKSYPDDRDGLLIKALSLAQRADFDPGVQIEAETTLDRYIDLYPTRTAPAFMIKGILASRAGDREKAFSNFDHAAIEYPRQAAALTDMLDAYLNRPYFTQTHEGLYFQQMYKATLEGYGAFSPNFQKAISYEEAGNREAAAQEIYDHFFRRGNQAVHDYLLSDMEYCDKYIHGAFSSIFPDSPLIDLKIEGKKPFMRKQRLDIALENKSDRILRNVRVFLCHHLVGMYPGDYVVEELPPVNSIPSDSSFSWQSREYAHSDIVYTRAVLLTDDQICWIDTPEYKAEHLSGGADGPAGSPKAPGASSGVPADTALVLPAPGR